MNEFSNDVTFYFNMLRSAGSQAETAAMLKFFVAVVLINGRWMMDRLQRHLEGTSWQWRKR